MRPAKAQTRSAVDNATAYSGLIALLILTYSGIAWLTNLPMLKTASILALSIGMSSLIVRLLQQRPTLSLVWAQFTAWVGLIFLIGSMWNALFMPIEPAVGADLGLAIIMLLLGFVVANATRRLMDSGAAAAQSAANDQR